VTGGLSGAPEECARLLDAGFDGVVLGAGLVGNARAGDVIRGIHETRSEIM
jgi:hypothetical protein